MERESFDAEVVVSVDTPGFGARIEHEDNVYDLVTGEVAAGTLETDGGDGGSPAVLVDSRVQELDAPDRYEGESVVVKLDYGAKDAKFTARGRAGTESNPAAFSAVRGEEPAGDLSGYEAAVKVLKRADSV
ncbi:hypothetical protein NDI76_11465 [Halogeometricum sp. S1BR25-6]|uniref:Uncharacterized protein n=1 Tax=Halogeometricum salsisoli TaxID=2950536 RepID=A0ABU2GEY7_9EURY|nr:hypothetical protein [Halogeometricum sp. S1BR25-6]MDS0299360.1 hypothetical protein [Halogeometricum sp. S1BR25-6]